MRYLTTVVAAAALLLAGVLGSACQHTNVNPGVKPVMYVDDDRPREVRVELDCPQENSCTLDYHDGHWYVSVDVDH